MNMRLQASELDIDSTCKLLSGIIVPRPIAWITTLSETGVVNLALVLSHQRQPLAQRQDRHT